LRGLAQQTLAVGVVNDAHALFESVDFALRRRGLHLAVFDDPLLDLEPLGAQQREQLGAAHVARSAQPGANGAQLDALVAALVSITHFQILAVAVWQGV
jgi:hypothetical protein